MIHITTVATATATSAVTLAANKITGVSDRFWFLVAGTGAESPRNIVNPIQASTPPPATQKASSETPKTWSTLAPTSAAITRMSKTARCGFDSIAELRGSCLTGLNLSEHGSADEGVHQRKHCHNRLKVLLHILENLN